jgi:hypothetical protein
MKTREILTSRGPSGPNPQQYYGQDLENVQRVYGLQQEKATASES